MSSFLASILNSAFGLLVNKLRDTAAEKLNDGDVADKKLRDMIVRDLNDIKTKLDGLSRKDLLSSFDFFRQGVDLLTVSLDKSSDLPSTSDESRRQAMNDGLAVSTAMGTLTAMSGNQFQSATERFKDARRKATEAFWNEALKIKDRIMAAKLFMAASMLENLDYPQTAIIDCQSFLEKLHDLPAIQEIFTVYLNGGLKSMVKKAERLENVKSVMLIDKVVFQFIFQFNRKYASRWSWPSIQLGNRSFNPVLDWREISSKKSWDEELRQPPCGLLLDEEIDYFGSAVNSRGDIIARDCLIFKRGIKVIDCGGKIKFLPRPKAKEGELVFIFPEAVAVDSEDNVYVLRWEKLRLENNREKCQHSLIVFDENFVMKYQQVLEFLGESEERMYIAVDSDKNIVICGPVRSDVYVSDECGRLKFKFKREEGGWRSLRISDKNEIIIAFRRKVYIYKRDGNLNIKLQIPEDLGAWGAVFHYVMSKIIVLTENRKQSSFFLLQFSGTGDLDTTDILCKCKRDFFGPWPSITSHPGGPVAVVSKKSILYI